MTTEQFLTVDGILIRSNNNKWWYSNLVYPRVSNKEITNSQKKQTYHTVRLGRQDNKYKWVSQSRWNSFCKRLTVFITVVVEWIYVEVLLNSDCTVLVLFAFVSRTKIKTIDSKWTTAFGRILILGNSIVQRLRAWERLSEHVEYKQKPYPKEATITHFNS